MKKNNIVLVIIAVIMLLAVITFATYAYFANTASITNVANLNVVSESNNMVFDTIGGGMLLNVTASNMTQAGAGNIAAENNTTLTVNFQANTEYSMVCTYDIVYEWTSTDKYQAHTTGVTDNEFTIQATLASNAHVSSGTNSIASETDFTTAVGNQTSATVVSGAQIDSTGTSTSTAVWTLTSKFHNVDANQNSLSDKTYQGNFKVANVSCIQGEVTTPGPTSYWFPSVYSYHNYETNRFEPNYTFPATGGTVQTSGSATGHSVYIGQNNRKYYSCTTINGHEVCVSQPYTQYGLSGHVHCDVYDNCSFTQNQQESVLQAVYQLFTDAGINLDTENDCLASSSDVYCAIDGLYFSTEISGYIGFGDEQEGIFCGINAEDHAYCASWD